MAKKTVTLIPSTTFGSAVGNYDGSSLSFASDKHKGDGYYGYADGVHTVAVFPTNLEATIQMQATLATDPAETDWFTIREITKPVTGTTGVTLSEAYTFTGNYVYLRVILDRSTLGDGSTYDAAYGAIGRVLLNN